MNEQKQVNIKYRTWFKGYPPKQIKLEIPGWAGEKNWDYGQPWHCKPFADAATYGLELIYPYDTSVRVTNENGECRFHYDSDDEWKFAVSEAPFKNFAPNHFGVTSSLDIKTEPGYGIMILPHPRYFTDMTGTVPLPSIGLIESDWWPNIFFIAYKAPQPGQEYIFEKGKGIAQILVVPKNPEYKIEKMTTEEASERELQSQSLREFGTKIATRKWDDNKGQTFDNKYKVLSHMDRKDPGAVCPYLNSMSDEIKKQKQQKIEMIQERMKRLYVKPERYDADSTNKSNCQRSQIRRKQC